MKSQILTQYVNSEKVSYEIGTFRSMNGWCSAQPSQIGCAMCGFCPVGQVIFIIDNCSTARALFQSHTLNAFCRLLAHFYLIAILSFNTNEKSIDGLRAIDYRSLLLSNGRSIVVDGSVYYQTNVSKWLCNCAVLLSFISACESHTFHCTD